MTGRPSDRPEGASAGNVGVGDRDLIVTWVLKALVLRGSGGSGRRGARRVARAARCSISQVGGATRRWALCEQGLWERRVFQVAKALGEAFG